MNTNQTRSNLMKTSLLAIITFLLLAGPGCTEPVPGGYVGMIRTPGGFTGSILNAGNHSCWGRDTMYLLEVGDTPASVEINQLTTDKINFKASIGVIFSVDRSNTKAITDGFSNITPTKGLTITAIQLFDTYIGAIVDQEARKVYSKYDSSDVVAKRGDIVEQVRAAVTTAFQSGLIKIKQVTVNNDDFPPDVTAAWNLQAQTKVEIGTEKAKQAKLMVAKNNQLALETIEYQIELVRSANIADSNKIIGSSITPEYLAWWQLKVLGEAAKGPNNWGFIPYTDYVNGKTNGITSGMSGERLTAPGMIDAELLKRIRDAREKGVEAKVLLEKEPPPSQESAPAPAPPQ